MEDFKIELIKELKGNTPDVILNILKNNNQLIADEKNLIYLYLNPRPLLDMELPKRIQNSRTNENNIVGSLTPNLKEATLIIEAYRSEQYNRYIKHLMYSFLLDPEKIHPVIGEGHSNCGICYKEIHEQSYWNENISNHDVNREYLAFRSDNSNIMLCLDCLIQLKYAHDILEKIEPGFLKYGKIQY